MCTFSGMNDVDYPNSEAFGVNLFPQAWYHSFPQELKDQFKRNL